MKIIQTSPYTRVENRKGKYYDLCRAKYIANNSTKMCEVYFFTCVDNPHNYHEKVTLPNDMTIIEDNKTGHLKVCKKGHLYE